MEENKQAPEANDQKIATGGAEKVTLNEDLEARNAVLEAEKVKLLEETVNYKAAYLKEKAKQADGGDDEERLRRIAREELSNSRLAEIAREQDTIIKKALKENKRSKDVMEAIQILKDNNVTIFELVEFLRTAPVYLRAGGHPEDDD